MRGKVLYATNSYVEVMWDDWKQWNYNPTIFLRKNIEEQLMVRAILNYYGEEFEIPGYFDWDVIPDLSKFQLVVEKINVEHSTQD